jgi:ABC-type transport system involved in Fe-S cluster assembly fused permease/ATPase subunit
VVLQATLASAAKVFHLLDTPPMVTDAPNAIPLPPIRGEIAFERVCFGYEPGRHVLHDVSLRIGASRRARWCSGRADRIGQDHAGRPGVLFLRRDQRASHD